MKVERLQHSSCHALAKEQMDSSWHLGGREGYNTERGVQTHSNFSLSFLCDAPQSRMLPKVGSGLSNSKPIGAAAQKKRKILSVSPSPPFPPAATVTRPSMVHLPQYEPHRK